MFEVKKISWWLWLATAGFLTLGLAGRVEGFYLAIALGVFQAAFFLNREPKITAFPVQVRIAYLALLVVALAPNMGFIHWIQFAGAWAMVLIGYCPLARTLPLMSWNSSQPLSFAAVKETVLARPVRGTVIQGFEATR